MIGHWVLPLILLSTPQGDSAACSQSVEAFYRAALGRISADDLARLTDVVEVLKSLQEQRIAANQLGRKSFDFTVAKKTFWSNSVKVLKFPDKEHPVLLQIKMVGERIGLKFEVVADPQFSTSSAESWGDWTPTSVNYLLRITW